MISLSLNIHSNNTKANIPVSRVLHRSPEVLQCDVGRENIRAGGSRSASVPEFRSVHGFFPASPCSVVITETKRNYQVLPTVTDQRVLEHSVSMEREGGPDSLLVLNTKSGDIMTIKVPKGRVRKLGIHPDNQWMVLSSTLPSSHASVVDLMCLRPTNENAPSP